jgi:hypothetical protein
MIACVYNSSSSYDEVINTLKYASKARKIEKKISKNVQEIDLVASQQYEFILKLQTEIESLRLIIK